MQLGHSRKSRAFIYAVLLHVLVLVVLIARTDSKSDPNTVAHPSLPIVKAHVVDQKLLDEQALRKKIAAEKKQREAQQKLAELEKKRRAAQQKAKDLEIEKARIKQEKLEKKRQIAVQKKALEKQQRALAEREAKAAQEKQRKELEQQKVREEAEKTAAALRQALENEEQELAAADQQRADNAEIARYIAAVQSKIASVFISPDLAEGLKCTLYVRMIPGGEVVEARVTQSSGNASYDRQAENAVRKAAPLPVPSNPRLFRLMREIQFIFDPEN